MKKKEKDVHQKDEKQKKKEENFYEWEYVK